MKEIYSKLIAGIPEYKEFLTVDEMDASSRALARQYPDRVELFEFGKTRDGHPLNCLKIGNGPINALVFGLPHPNEPIGTMLIEYFTRQLAENDELQSELGYTWYFVKAWDADGTKLNENWFKGPFTIENYVRNFYRPAGYEQVDWTFPVDYKELHFHNVLPESEAMMKLIDNIKPRFIYSLHNAGFGGVYWYISAPTPGLYDEFHAIPARFNVPIHMGEPESPSCIELSKAIYQSLGISTEYDYLEQYSGMDMKEVVKMINCGDCSASYAYGKYNTFTLLTEMPYFYDARINDLTPADITRRDAVLKSSEMSIEDNKELRAVAEVSKAWFDKKNHFYLAVEAFTSNDEGGAEAVKQMMEGKPEYDRMATQAEKFDSLMVSRFYKSLTYSLLHRANVSELELMEKNGETNPEKKAALEKGRDLAKAGLDRIIDYLETNLNYSAVPIKNLVSIQLLCGILMADYLKEHPEI